MKLFKHKHFMSLIYSVLVALPFFAILGRVLYTQWNQNAHESYYGENINEVTYDEINMTDMVVGQNYIVTTEVTSDEATGTYFIYSNTDLIVDNVVREGYNEIRFFGNYVAYYGTGLTAQYLRLNNGIHNLQFNFSSYLNQNYNLTFHLYKIVLNDYSFLDNAFEYSLDTFVKDNNFGNLDFFSWFSNIFLDTSNAHNMLYINFINWYLNYTLFISLAYILFLVLMWFVSFARRLLENSQNMNIGGL